MEGLEELTELQDLHLAENQISMVEGLGTLVKLRSIFLGANEFNSVDSVAGLVDCPAMASIDLRDNKLDAEDGYLELFSKMPNLSNLYLKGTQLYMKTK